MPGVKGMPMPKCPPGCTCGKHKPRKNTGKKCPPGCKCGRHIHPQSAETRRKISESHIKRVLAQGELKQPDKKRCAKCKKWKRLPEDFYYKKQHLKSGLVRSYPESLCTSCRQKKNKQWVKDQGPKKMRERRRQYVENRKQKLGLDEFRRREREKRAFQHHREGKKKHAARTSPGSEPKVDRIPIVNFALKELKRRGWSKMELAKRSGIDPSRLDRIIAGEEKSKKVKSGVIKINKINWDNVDRILWALDREEMLTILYPDDEVVNAAS